MEMALSGEFKTNYEIDGDYPYNYRVTWSAVKKPFDNSADITFNYYITNLWTDISSTTTYGMSTKIGSDTVTTPGEERTIDVPVGVEVFVNSEVINVKYTNNGTKGFGAYAGRWAYENGVPIIKEDVYGDIPLETMHKTKIKKTLGWLPCSPWIKVNGVWKRCIVWNKINGVWEKST